MCCTALLPVLLQWNSQNKYFSHILVYILFEQVLSLEVDGSRLVAKVSAKFSSGEVSPGDAISVQVALLSLLPVDARLESLEVERQGMK